MKYNRPYKYPMEKEAVFTAIKSKLHANNWLHIYDAEIVSMERCEKTSPFEVHLTLYIKEFDISIFWDVREELNRHIESSKIHQSSLDIRFPNKNTSVCTIRWDYTPSGYAIFPTWEPWLDNWYGPGDVKLYLKKYLEL